MPDVSKVKINNNEYNLKDATAREDAATAQSTADSKVSKSGDTMTGALRVIQSYRGNVEAFSSQLESANINTPPETTEYIDTLHVFDGIGNRIGLIRNYINPSGQIIFELAAQRPISGGTIFNSIGLSVDASGNRDVSVSDPAAWRSAIWSNNSFSQELPAAVSVENNTATTIASHTFAKGFYIISYGALFASNNSGYREVWLSTTSNGSSIGHLWRVSCAPANGDSTSLNGIIFHQVNSGSQTLYVVAKQSSGTALNITGRMLFLKLN